MAGGEWPRYCRALLLASVESAAKAFPAPPDRTGEAVHGLRRTLKQARALARLFREIGEPARVTIAALSSVRRGFGRTRDLDVMEHRLARLAPPAEIAKPIAEAIARDRSAARRAHGGFGASAAAARLAAIARRVRAWDLDRVDNRDIVTAAARVYRQARRRGRRAFAANDAAKLHALRARVVDLRYELAALAPAWPAALTAQADEMNALRDTLGAFNDLDMLARFAGERCALSSEAMGALLKRLELKQKKLRRRAEVEFDRLFAEAPSAFEERLAAYLKRPMEAPGAALKLAPPPPQP